MLYGGGLNDNGIKNLNLRILDVEKNPNITNINHMTNLKRLDASYNSGINDNGIKDLNLNRLNINNNPKITEHAAKRVSRFAR